MAEVGKMQAPPPWLYWGRLHLIAVQQGLAQTCSSGAMQASNLSMAHVRQIGLLRQLGTGWRVPGMLQLGLQGFVGTAVRSPCTVFALQGN